MELKGWEEIDQDTWIGLPLPIRATVTFGDPYKIIYIAETDGLKKLNNENAERNSTTDAEEAVEGNNSGAEDNEA